jgi:hypothetical protein
LADLRQNVVIAEGKACALIERFPHFVLNGSSISSLLVVIIIVVVIVNLSARASREPTCAQNGIKGASSNRRIGSYAFVTREDVADPPLEGPELYCATCNNQLLQQNHCIFPSPFMNSIADAPA